MKGTYIIKIDRELLTYDDFDDIPDAFDHLIKFAPEYPEPPHTDEQHEEMATYNDKLQELMTRETK